MTKPELSNQQLDQLLAAARDSWRTDAEFDRDALWERIEHEHFDRTVQAPTPPWRTPNWRMVGAAAAAALVIGAGLGRWSATGSETAVPVAVAESAESARPHDDPMRLTTTEYLGETAALLAALQRDAGSGAIDARFASDAATLLFTTRLLLDSNANTDAQLLLLLDDLELVLAQIARLPARRDGDELQLISEAILARDVVPRLHLAAADYQSDN